MTEDRLEGVALVTGATGTIGRHIVRVLSDAGMTVGVADLDAGAVAEVAAEHGGVACAGDVTDPEAIAGWVAALGGDVDLLVNNAGIDGAAGTDDADPELWWRTMEVNVRGPYLCVHAVLPRMKERGSGRIINLGSGGAFFTGVPLASMSYCASKAALCRFSELLAERTQDAGIAVFTLSPGFVDTGLTRGQGTYTDRIWDSPDLAARFIARIAHGDLDRLRGRYLRATDDIAELMADTDRIIAEDLKSIRLRGGPTTVPRPSAQRA